MPDRVPLGTTAGTDTEATPPGAEGAFPLHTAASLVAVYLFGYLGWHWSYALVIFWLLVCADSRLQSRRWAVLQREARAAAAAASGAESATWLNELVRAVWPLYELPMARWATSRLQPLIDEYKPAGLGIKALRIKSFSFGTVDARRTDGRHRLAPLLFDKLQMVSKSVEAAPGSRDPRLQRIRYVLLADVRWHAGAAPALTLDIQLGPKFLSLVSVDAEVRDLIGSGTLRLELDFVRPYPWLGTVYASFVKTPSLDFKLSLGGSPDVMDLAPPLRKHLKSIFDQTLQECMVGPNRLCIPLTEWYGAGGDPEALVTTVTAAAMAAPFMPPQPQPAVAAASTSARSAQPTHNHPTQLHPSSRNTHRRPSALSSSYSSANEKPSSVGGPTAGAPRQQGRQASAHTSTDAFNASAAASAAPSRPSQPRRRASDDSSINLGGQTAAQRSGAQLAAAISKAVANRIDRSGSGSTVPGAGSARGGPSTGMPAAEDSSARGDVGGQNRFAAGRNDSAEARRRSTAGYVKDGDQGWKMEDVDGRGRGRRDGGGE